MTKTIVCSLILILATACSAALPASADLSQRPIRAVATTGMIGDIIRNVGGERVYVEVLMGPGVDPHLFKASEGDVIHLGEADIVFYNGLHLEAGMAKVLEHMSGSKHIVPVSDYIDRTLLFTPPQFKGNYDPHIWFDVTLWMQATQKVRDALIELDPTSADLYRQQAEAYLQQLSNLNQYLLDQAAQLPPEKRVLITAHDAFSYFGRAYGFEVRGLQGISTAAEASTLDVQELATFIVQRQIPAIFVESSVPQRTIEAVQAAVQARGFDVQVGGSLFSDAMGSASTPEGTYIGMVTHNMDIIVNALIEK